MTFRVDDEHRALVFQQYSGGMAQVLAWFAVDDRLTLGFARQIHKRNRIATRRGSRCLERAGNNCQRKQDSAGNPFDEHECIPGRIERAMRAERRSDRLRPTIVVGPSSAKWRPKKKPRRLIHPRAIATRAAAAMHLTAGVA